MEDILGIKFAKLYLMITIYMKLMIQFSIKLQKQI